jgi:RHS repeat-associated protein
MEQRASLKNHEDKMKIKISTGIVLAICLAGSICTGHAQTTNTTQQILQMQTFREGVVWIGDKEPSEAENTQLLEVLTNLDKPSWTSDLTQFLQDHPKSPWAASLRYDYASFYRRTGRTTKALEQFEAAWALAKNDSSPQGQNLGGAILANWMDLLSSLGRTEKLKELIAVGDQWHFVNAEDRDKFQGAKHSYYLMQEHPGIAYRCGTFALKAVGEKLQSNDPALEELTELPSPTNGFSMASLLDIAKQYGLHMVAVRRTAGQDLIVPSVVHWRQNHYAAILDKQDDNYLVSDPTFGTEKWISGEAINEEASGEFLIPSALLTNGWTQLARNETAKIRGMGLPNNINDGKDKCCVTLFNGQISCAQCSGMPIWWISEPYINLWMSDQPLSYLTSRGEPFTFQITYKQRDTRVPSLISTAGWNNSWQSYVHMNSTIINNATFAACDIAIFLPNGGEADLPHTSGATRYDSEDRLTVMQQGFSLASGADDGDHGLRVVHSDGSQDIYGGGRIISISGDYPYGDFFRTRHIDPNGDTTWFQYDSYGGPYVLTFVVDPDGRTNFLSYNTSSSLLLSVTNAYGQSAHFKYDSKGNLTNIVDAQGLSSSISWDTNNYPTSLATPYGTTTFSVFANSLVANTNDTEGNFGGDDLIDRSVLVTDPVGAKSLYMYRYDCSSASPVDMSPTFSSSDVPTNTPLGTLDDGNGSSTNTLAGVCYRNSFYWGPRQYAGLSTTDIDSLNANDYLRGRMQHWLEDTNQLYLTGYLSVERDPSPDGSTEGLKTFYDYQGKLSGYNFCAGNYPLPSVRAWRLPSGETHYEYLKFDYFGNITNDITTYTLANGSMGARTNQFIYADNTYTYLLGTWNGTGFQNTAYATPFTVPDLLTEVIGADGNTIWAYGGFDTVTWTNFFYSSSGDTNGSIMTSLRVLPDYATNGVGQVATTTYTSSGRPVNYYDMFQGSPLGTNYNYGTLISTAYSGNNKVTSKTSVAGLTTTNIYNANGFLTQTIDLQIGRTNSFSYTTDGLIGTFTNELGLNVAATWDNLLRPTSIQFPDGTSISNLYNKLDLSGERDRLGNWTYYGYDGARHLTSITNANNAVTMLDWCGCGALTEIMDPLSNPTTFNYDNQGNLTNVTYPDSSTLNYQYNLAAWPIALSDGEGRSVQLGYNNQGLITTANNTYGQVYAAAYDIRDRQMVITDGNGVTVTNSYNAIDELLAQTWPDGISDRFGYAASGLIAATNRDNQVTLYGRDVAGRLTSITNANNEIIKASYDPSSDITSLVDALNHTTSWQYNQYGWLTNKVDGLTRNAFRYSYNANGWITNRWTPEKGNTGYAFDNVGNPTSVIYPQLTISYGYDPLNELTNMVDAVGTTKFTYTSAGLLASEIGPWADDAITYTYSEQLQTALNLSQPSGSWSQSYSYDSMWRMTSIVSPAGTFNYSYNFQPASSLVTGIQLPNGASIANTYNSLARLTQTTLNNTWGHTLDGYTHQYDPLGLRTNLVRNLGLTTSSVNVGYDSVGQLTSWIAKESGGTPRQNEQLGFGYDAAQNLHSRTSGGLSQTFNTDAANELTSVTRSGTFTLSGATPAPATSVTVNGNAAQTYGDFTFASTNNTLANGANTFTVIAQNAYGTKTTNNLAANLPSSVSLSSDNNGSLTSDGARTFGYDSENQVTNITVAGQWRSDFVYDGLNRRRIVRDYTWSGSAWVETNEVRYIYDGYLLLQERDAYNNPLVTYTHGLDFSGDMWDAGGIGGLLARTDANGSTYYHSDGLGNVTALMDSQQNIVGRYLYGPFGKLIGKWGTLADANEMQFSSMPQHDGLTFFPFRAYEPNFQRWLNQDPIQETGGINLYQFALNNPMFWIDPFGLDPLGHHLVPRQIWQDLSDRVKKVWDKDPKNRLDAKDYKDHNGKNYGPKNGPKVKCKDYNKAVNDKLNKYLEDKGVKSAEDLTDKELQDFADEIKNTTDGDIGAYNEGVADEIAEAEAAAAEGTEAAEVAEALTVAAEVDEAVVATGAIIK